MLKNYFVRENIFFYVTLILCIAILFHFLFPFVLGVTLAYLIEPIVNKLTDRLNTKKLFWKWIISILLMILTIGLVFGPILTLLTNAIEELVAVTNEFQSKSQGQDLILPLVQKLSDILQKFGMNFSVNDLLVKFTELIKSASHVLLINVGSALYATPGFILKFVVFLLTWCFFLVKGKAWRVRFLTKIFPWEKERELIAHTCSSVLKALIVANVLVAVAQAFLITISLAIFEVPRFILLGMIAFFMSFIPIVGTAPLMLCAAAWCYFSEGRLGAAVGILVSGVVISLLDNILRPYFMKGGVELQFFWIFLAIICGMSLLGLPGAVLGPVAFALFAAALRALELRYEKN